MPPSAKTLISAGIIRRSRPCEPLDEPADPGLDRPGLHRHAEEAADHEDEQRDVDRAEQRPGVVVVDVPGLVLDAVQAVDRGRERVDEDPRRLRVDLVVRPGDRLAVGVQVVRAGRDDPGRDRRQHDQREQDRVRGRKREPALLLRFGRRGSLDRRPPRSTRPRPARGRRRRA